ncbi:MULTISPECIES: hypothetical protein [unclassified Serratia (in: enterobacteria)]|uniref:hypothetical protein n=1 Tax=unclassified Serratia (in: enterobacteria) TaxID=2647522 RepID=UPI002ED3831F|nr:hypothetical protein [Serratia sp. C2(2)]MEE4445766.1 hypothetical protein [Serratia sp. C2(1)]
MADIVKYQNNVVKGAELIPPPHPMDGSCKSSILIYCDREPELSKTLQALGEWEEIVFDVNGEKVRCQVEKFDRQRNVIMLKTEQEQSGADIPYQQ